MSDDFTIRLARELPDYEACIGLQRSVWGLSDLEVTSTIQFIATIHAGGMLHLAVEADGSVIGFAYGFASIRGGVPHLHSDMLAVLPDKQKRGIGVRLKWAQREEALRRGLTLVTWTFDPLQARNAHLNLRRLGGYASEFLPNFYGITTSSLHQGLATNRLFVRWELESPRVKERASLGEPPATVPTPQLPRINDVKWQAGWAVSSEPRLDLSDDALLLEIPPDFETIGQAAPRVAQDWHGKVGRALEAYFSRGYVAADFAPTEEGGRRRPLYVLRKKG